MSVIRALALTGPTGSGKTALSLHLSRAFGCEIISCDSMQIYRGMDIGTAKATAEERRAVPHHMIDVCEPTEDFSVSDYVARVRPLLADMQLRGVTPLLVGGTGLYLSALLRPELPTPPADPAYTEAARALAEREGVDVLYDRLRAVDPVSAASIHRNNVRRVIRALEIYDRTGRPKSVWDEQSRRAEGAISLLHFTLDAHRRATLYERTDARIDGMVRDGLVEEVRTLYAAGQLPAEGTAAQAIGYKELLPLVCDGVPLDTCLDELRLNTRHYVKRQLTWFSHLPDVCRVYIDDEDGTPRPPTDVLAELYAVCVREGFTPRLPL